MSRRSYGSGSLYQRKTDGLWIGRLEGGFTREGARRRITVSAKTRAECLRKLRAKQLEIATGRSESSAGGGTTVAQWVKTWLEIRESELRPNTLEQYRGSLVHVVDVIGKRRISQLNRGDLRAVTKSMLDAGLSTTTAGRAHAVLRKMLRDAVSESIPVPPEVFTFKPPRPAVNTRREIPTADVRALIRTAAALPDHSRWDAALILGMRQGECLGLTWECVNLERGTIDLAWQLQELPYTDGPGSPPRVPHGFEYRTLFGRYNLVRPKSAAGVRVIPLPPYIQRGLADWKEVQSMHWNEYGLVWPGPDGRPRSKVEDGEAWKALQTLADVSKGDGFYVIHEARHSAATLLLEEGVDPQIVRQIAGHSKVETTRGYQHVSIELARRALGAVTTRLELT